MDLEQRIVFGDLRPTWIAGPGIRALLCAVLALLGAASAADVELLLPPLSKSSRIASFVFTAPTHVLLGRDNAVCELDLGRKDLSCRETQGRLRAMVAIQEKGKPLVISAVEAESQPSEDREGSCRIALHALVPDSGPERVLANLELPCRPGTDVSALLTTGDSGRGPYLAVTTGLALRVFSLVQTPEGYRLVPVWAHRSEPKANGWLAGDIEVAISDRAVYVLESWNDFPEGTLEILRHDLAGNRSETLSVPVPPDLRDSLGASELLVSPDDANLLMIGQVGADPGQFLLYDLEGRRTRCHFTDRSLRSLHPGRNVQMVAGPRILAASTDGSVKELDLCGQLLGSARVDYLPAQLPLDLLGLQVSPDGRRLYALLEGGVVAVVERPRGRLLANLFLLENDEWAVLLPEGYYSASPRGHDDLGFLHDDQAIGLNQFYDAFYRPDLVDRRLAGASIEGLIPATIEEAIREPPPQVRIFALPPGGVAGPVDVRYRIESSGGGIGEVRAFHNGKLVWSDGALAEPTGLFARPRSVRDNGSRAIVEELRGAVALPSAGTDEAERLRRRPQIRSATKGDVFEGAVPVVPVSGENEIALIAFNAANTVQSRLQSIAFRSSTPERPGHLHILAVGIDHYRDPTVALRFAAKDARDFAAGLAARARTLYPEQAIHASIVIDGEASRTRLLDRFQRLADQVTAEDQLVLFVASHGVLLGGQYYMLTQDYDGALKRDNLIGSGELIETSRRARALSQLIVLDTCHAGGMDGVVAGLYDARISVLARKMGLHVYASAGSLESALDGYRGNGLFTHTLLQGLAGSSDTDSDRDGTVSVVELGRHANRLTRAVSASIGHPQSPTIIEFGRDRALYRLTEPHPR
jgi:hypothetical protein